jgi:hypothetical protein
VKSDSVRAGLGLSWDRDSLNWVFCNTEMMKFRFRNRNEIKEFRFLFSNEPNSGGLDYGTENRESTSSLALRTTSVGPDYVNEKRECWLWFITNIN